MRLRQDVRQATAEAGRTYSDRPIARSIIDRITYMDNTRAFTTAQELSDCI